MTTTAHERALAKINEARAAFEEAINTASTMLADAAAGDDDNERARQAADWLDEAEPRILTVLEWALGVFGELREVGPLGADEAAIAHDAAALARELRGVTYADPDKGETRATLRDKLEQERRASFRLEAGARTRAALADELKTFVERARGPGQTVIGVDLLERVSAALRGAS